ncbi:heterokaryon incompatibility protein-domain-containing protein [Leptodontidium sp. 2 PMI_412]|nr:heterokaryon incompatibility protein-domain-containing protein [Leptodontidium sp. 2 PMI_412]
MYEKEGKGEEDISVRQPVYPNPYPSPRMTDAHEIRVLELLPGSEEQPIHCLLTIEHLWDDPRYEALSYAWGSSAETKPMQLNKTSFEITSNLEIALRHLRHEQESRRLWVDALCINQNDPIEKQTQVKLMSEIYPAAENVLCWLGPEEDDSAFVMQRLQELADAKARRQRFYQGLFKLLSRQWWSRLWTCQEFALTLKDPQMVCGKQCMRCRYFNLAALHYPNMSLAVHEY